LRQPASDAAALAAQKAMTSRCRIRELASRSACALAVLAVWGCSASSPPGGGDGGSGGGSAGSAGGAGSLGLGGNLTTPPGGPRCNDGSLRCRKVDCPADSSPSTTSVTGVVYDPAGRVPLYNAVVYVAEEADLEPLGQRAQCESCSAHFPKAGALALGLSDANGRFRVPNMPSGDDVPLIIQLGKWRRVVHIPRVEPCANTVLDKELTRLPRSSAEGDLPHIAVTTGGSDALECLVRKIGVDLSEFSTEKGQGRVHLFAGYGSAKHMQSDGALVPLTPAENLWASADAMLGYDMMLMSCEGTDNTFNPPDDEDFPDDAIERPPAMHLEVRKYADLGGRIFGSHWHHRWINSGDSTPDDPYPKVAQFASSAEDIGDPMVAVDSTFPKGVAFRDWLVNVGASTTPGRLPLVKAEHSVDSVDPSLARRWIYGTDDEGDGEPTSVQYFSFTTPVAEQECGRMVFSDVHVTFGGEAAKLVPFPERCGDQESELTPQEKALEFMIFDLSSCIQKEDDPVRSPITVVK
jgi:hypothetical protein